MKIISKFQDYYDGVAASGYDDTRVFLRHMKEMSRKEFGAYKPRIVRPQGMNWNKTKKWEAKHESLGARRYVVDGSSWSHPRYRNWDEILTFHTVHVGFCGRIYKGYHIIGHKDPQTYYDDINNEINFFAWTQEDIFALMDELSEIPNPCKGIKEFLDTRDRSNWNGIPAGVNEGWEDLTPFVRHQIPIFLVAIDGKIRTRDERTRQYLHKKQYVVNPCLKDVQFYKVKDTWTAFQEIDMFLGGVLTSQPEMIEVSNESKILNSGLDPKWGFRKMPGKRKPRKQKS